MKYAVVNKKGVVENIINWDGVTPLAVEQGLTLRPANADDKPPLVVDEQQQQIKKLIEAEVAKQLTK